MHMIATTNWLAVVGYLYVGCALGLLARAASGTLAHGGPDRDTPRAASQRVNALFSLPFLVVGLVLLIAAQFGTGSLSAPIVVLTLSLAAALILFAALEDLLVEFRVADQPASQSQPRPMPAPIPADLERPTLQIVHTS